MKNILVIILCTAGLAGAADLTISGQSGKTYQNQSYGKCVITNSSNITIRNCNFSSAASKVISIDGSSSGITFENCDIDGRNETCQAVQSSGSNLVFKNCELHDIADDGFSMHGGSNLQFIGCSVHDLIGKGTDGIIDGPCYNGHSDGWELANIHGCKMIGNIAYNIKSTSALHMGNWDGAKDNQDFLLANNLFYTPEVGFCIYVHYIDGIELYNNTFWKGKNGGLALGWGVKNLKARNNIISIINTSHSGVTPSPTEHDFDWNLVGLASGGYPLQPHDVFAPNVLFKRIPPVIGGDIIHDVKPEDFELQSGSPAIDKGTSGGNIPTTDYYGTTRTGTYDMGGIEYTGTGLDDTRPLQSARSGNGIAVFAVRGVILGKAVMGVYDGAGQLVARVAPDGNRWVWNGITQTGTTAVRGVYFYRVRVNGTEYSGSLVRL